MNEISFTEHHPMVQSSYRFFIFLAESYSEKSVSFWNSNTSSCHRSLNYFCLLLNTESDQLRLGIDCRYLTMVLPNLKKGLILEIFFRNKKNLATLWYFILKTGVFSYKNKNAIFTKIKRLFFLSLQGCLDLSNLVIKIKSQVN